MKKSYFIPMVSLLIISFSMNMGHGTTNNNILSQLENDEKSDQSLDKSIF